MADPPEPHPGFEQCDGTGFGTRATAHFDLAPAGLAVDRQQSAAFEDFDPAGSVFGLVGAGVGGDPNGRRPRPADRDWSNALAGAYALATHEAVDLAVDLSRRAEKLFDAAPKLRAKGAERVIEMLLADDCVAPARAAKRAKLSDRAARRLFDRLIEVGVVRELTRRTSFRLYGL